MQAEASEIIVISVIYPNRSVWPVPASLSPVIQHGRIRLCCRAVPPTPHTETHKYNTYSIISNTHENEMNGVFGHDSALYGYIELVKTWPKPKLMKKHLEQHMGSFSNTCISWIIHSWSE